MQFALVYRHSSLLAHISPPVSFSPNTLSLCLSLNRRHHVPRPSIKWCKSYPFLKAMRSVRCVVRLDFKLIITMVRVASCKDLMNTKYHLSLAIDLLGHTSTSTWRCNHSRPVLQNAFVTTFRASVNALGCYWLLSRNKSYRAQDTISWLNQLGGVMGGDRRCK